MKKDEISEMINKEVQDYTNISYAYLDAVKVLVFTYLLQKITYEVFRESLEILNKQYGVKLIKRQNTGYKNVKDKVIKTNKKPIAKKKISFSKETLQNIMFKLDKTSQAKAKDKYVRVIKDFYKTTLKTAKKEYININDYLSDKVSNFDKVEKVIPYFNKDGTIRAYHDISSYNSMVYNTNLTSEAWNSTMKYCQDVGTDIVYVEPHPFSCPLCQEWQGKFYSLTGQTPGYRNIEVAYAGGLKHPNCKHNITTNVGQKETDDYSSDEWKARYEARQKKQALELKRRRLKTDRDIYKKLNNYEEVDKINSKIRTLNSAIKEQKELMK